MSEHKRKEALLARCREEGRIFGDRSIALDMDLTTAVSIRGALQLALRNEGFCARPSATLVRDFVFAVRALLARCREQGRSFGDRSIALDTDPATAVSICGALQLALRNEGFCARPSATLVRDFVFAVRDRLGSEMPATRELIGLGFHPRFDEAAEGKAEMTGAVHVFMEEGAVQIWFDTEDGQKDGVCIGAADGMEPAILQAQLELNAALAELHRLKKEAK